MPTILSWTWVSRERWTIQRCDVPCACLVYSLRSLPDFSEPRFAYLAKEPDARVAKVVQLQLQMLRRLHGLGPEWTFSLRLVKERSITLYLVSRCSRAQGIDARVLDLAKDTIKSILMGAEYTFSFVEEPEKALELSWAREASVIFKQEEEYRGADYPTGDAGQRFYVPYAWTSTDNNMRHICEALMRHPGRAVVEVALTPGEYLDDERDWMNVSLDLLKNVMNGETIRDEKTNRIIWQAEKMPALKPAVDNVERMSKQYETSHVFLSAVHVYAESGAASLAGALMANSVKNQGVVCTYRASDPHFGLLRRSYQNVDVPADVISPYWNRHYNDPEAPYRAQRLQRLVSLEEISSFFRIPIPVQSGFPGFSLDTGLGEAATASAGIHEMAIGRYLDITGASEDAMFDIQQFAKHGLIVGVPGSGKTTAMFSILHQLWDSPPEERIPFIVLEPAKTEYRALKGLPAFADDMLVFTLGDEDTSPFRFNPFEVLPGIRLENHISRLQACFVGAFDLFDPLPIFLEQAIRRTYLEQGWYDDSRGGEPGLITPTLTDLVRNAEWIVEHSGFDPKMKSDFKASLLERLNSLRRGSKGRMLDCRHSIPMDDLMGRPVVLELDNLNGDEKSLIMMFLLSYVFEYCKSRRTSGSPLKHLLVVEEAHNLISSQQGETSRANPRAQTIELFVNMLAEMRALGQGILIADQLPTAIAPQAVKQTNLKLLMRVTARDDREEIGSTMDLDDEQMHQVVNFKTGHAYLYHEGEDRVRMIRMPDFKREHRVNEPPDDATLGGMMASYERDHCSLYMPFDECASFCERCSHRTRNQAESFVAGVISSSNEAVYRTLFPDTDDSELHKLIARTPLCGVCALATKREAQRIRERYGSIDERFGACAYVHLINQAQARMEACRKTRLGKCDCGASARSRYREMFTNWKGDDS